MQRLFEDVAYKYLDSNFGFLCRYDPSRYAGRDEDVSDMEADFATIEMEEKRRYCFSYFIPYNIVQIEIKAYIIYVYALYSRYCTACTDDQDNFSIIMMRHLIVFFFYSLPYHSIAS